MPAGGVTVARGDVIPCPMLGGGGTVRGIRSRRPSGTATVGGVPGCAMTAGDGCCPGGRVGCAGTRGGTAGAAPGTAAPPGTAIGRARPGGGTCVRVGWLAKLLRT
ncbi:MAG TPA: hypothetical protein VLJ62_26625, partial [Burkholderiaceae bacterium]|nr:hypothetical protein [Burkholderiaceae bacterium]